ncbi:hypothetical protein L7F22_030547 [Adiantum nelumboides]|nr:hypothetical protein [Adiantum nelumboides]
MELELGEIPQHSTEQEKDPEQNPPDYPQFSFMKTLDDITPQDDMPFRNEEPPKARSPIQREEGQSRIRSPTFREVTHSRSRLPIHKEDDEGESKVRLSVSKDSKSIHKKKSHKKKKEKDFKSGDKDVKFDSYNGRRDMDKALAFIRQFEVAFAEEAFSEKSKLRHVGMYLKGTANSWWLTLILEEKKPADWPSFKKAFYTQFLPLDFEEEAKKEWDRLSQLENKMVPQFVDKFWDVLLKVTPFKKIDEVEKMRKFEAGLHDDSQKAMKIYPRNTLQVLMESARIAEGFHQKGTSKKFEQIQQQEEDFTNLPKCSILTIVEVEDVALAEAVAQADLGIFSKTSKTRTMQKIQVAAEEEEICKQGGVLEEEVDGNKQQRQNTNSDVCWICGRYGHFANDCYQRNNNRRFNGRNQQQGNYASTSNNDNDGRLFVMQHMMSASAHDASANDVWYVDSGDDTIHPIEHVGNVPLSMDNGKDKFMDVPTITKNLVSVGQMVEQVLQVRFNEHGCFVEDFKNRCRLVAKGNKNGRMFTLNVNMPKAGKAMYAQGASVILDVDIWHKRIGHVNPQRLKSMQAQEIVTEGATSNIVHKVPPSSARQILGPLPGPPEAPPVTSLLEDLDFDATQAFVSDKEDDEDDALFQPSPRREKRVPGWLYLIVSSSD